MKDSYSKKQAVEILERALSKKDSKADTPIEFIRSDDLEKMAAELGITKTDLDQAATDVNSTVEKNRSDLYPEVITTRRINGTLSDREIEILFSELKNEFGSAKKWDGSPIMFHKIGNTWEYGLKDATIMIKEEADGYQLQVIKTQFFHGNILESGILAIPVAFIIGLLPVAAAFEWIHLFAAILVGAACYLFSVAMLKKMISKERAKTVSRILHITEYAEQTMKNMLGEKQICLDDETINISDEDITSDTSRRNRHKL